MNAWRTLLAWLASMAADPVTVDAEQPKAYAAVAAAYAGFAPDDAPQPEPAPPAPPKPPAPRPTREPAACPCGSAGKCSPACSCGCRGDCPDGKCRPTR